MTSTVDPEYWRERWLEGRTGWDRGDLSPALVHWLEQGALEPCRILIPGCGNGYEVDALAARGFRVTALDIVPEPLEALGKRLKDKGLQAEIVQGDVFTYTPGDGAFDAVYEQTCLCAFHPDYRAEYAAQLTRWVRPGGMLYALFAQTPWRNGPPFHSAPEQMQQLLPDALWEWPDAADVDIPHEAGFRELGYRLRRRE